MAFLYNIEKTECIGNSLPKFNSNFTSLNEDITTITETINQLNGDVSALKISEEASRKYVGAPGFYKESSFTYGVNHIYGTPSLQNTWHDIWTNPSKEPLRIKIKIQGAPKAVMLFGRVHLRFAYASHSAWVRLARFSSMQRDAVPMEVLDIASAGGGLYTNVETALPLSAPYLLEPDTEYIFGLQSWFYWWSGAAAAAKGARKDFGDKTTVAEVLYGFNAYFAPYASIIVNGWVLDDKFSEQFENTKEANLNNLADVQAVNRSLQMDGYVGDLRIGQNVKKYGYSYTEEALAKEIKNIAFIRAVVL
jgi:hypothetical protein